MNTMFDGRVVAYVEMQKRLILESAPIPSIHRLMIAYIKGPRDDFAIPFGQYDAHMRGHTAVKLIEKIFGQVLAAVVESIDMALVKTKHRPQLLPRQLLPFDCVDGYPLLKDLAPLALNLVPAIAAKTR